MINIITKERKKKGLTISSDVLNKTSIFSQKLGQIRVLLWQIRYRLNCTSLDIKINNSSNERIPFCRLSENNIPLIQYSCVVM